MRKRLIPWFIGLALGTLVAPARAGTILVSGDVNIVNVLGDSSFDNDLFFRRVLGSGTSVKILQQSVVPDFDFQVDHFYDGLPGVTSSLFSGPVTPAELGGTDLLISLLPDDPFSPSETAAMAAFLSGGGTIFFMGDNPLFPAE